MLNLVCIVGIDGTGKTTLARGLAQALQERGLSTSYIYGRTRPFVSRGLMAVGRAAFLRNSNPRSDYQTYSVSKKRAMRNRWLARIYSSAILLDYYPQIWIKLLPHLLARRIVVCDRYVYDTVISDLAVHLSYTDRDIERAIERCMRFVPKPTLTVLLDAPPAVAFARKNDVPHLDYLTERREHYLRLKERPEVKLYDGESRPTELIYALAREVISQ